MQRSIRLDTEEDSALEDIVERRVTPYEMVEDLIGCVSGGPEDLSSRTGEKFRALLLETAGRSGSP